MITLQETLEARLEALLIVEPAAYKMFGTSFCHLNAAYVGLPSKVSCAARQDIEDMPQ